MNLELISKLYEQSHKTVPHQPISGLDAELEDRVFVPELFAELLLTDFINALHESNFYSSETTENSLNIIIKGAKTFLELKNERN